MYTFGTNMSEFKVHKSISEKSDNHLSLVETKYIIYNTGNWQVVKDISRLQYMYMSLLWQHL